MYSVPLSAKFSQAFAYECSSPLSLPVDADVSVSGTPTTAKGKDRRFKAAHKPIAGSGLRETHTE